MAIIFQSRTRGPILELQQSEDNKAHWFNNGSFPYLQPLQETESFRTSSEIDPLSPEAIKEWMTVTRNGLTTIDPRFDNGHEFFTTKTSWHQSHPLWTRNSAVRGARWRRGPLVPVAADGGAPLYPVAPRISATELGDKGARAIKATLPTKSVLSLATTLGELTEGLPALIGLGLLKKRAQVAHSSGSEYLNVQFGWLPLISDVKKIAKAVADSSTLLSQYRRDSGKTVRRNFRFPEEVTSDVTTYAAPGDMNLYGWSQAQQAEEFITNSTSNRPITQETKTRRRVWFSGAYSYYLGEENSSSDLERFAQQANHLLGVQLTPSVLWELTPWSWFVDWIFSIGGILATAEALGTDGLVIRYGYLMVHTTQTVTYSIPGGITFVGGAKSGPISITLSRETKERRKATPYGFGLNTSGFNPKQWAILGALGLTKVPGRL